MIKKVDILGIQLDNYTVREAIMCVERYLSNNVLNTIEYTNWERRLAVKIYRNLG